MRYVTLQRRHISERCRPRTTHARQGVCTRAEPCDLASGDSNSRAEKMQSQSLRRPTEKSSSRARAALRAKQTRLAEALDRLVGRLNHPNRSSRACPGRARVRYAPRKQRGHANRGARACRGPEAPKAPPEKPFIRPTRSRPRRSRERLTRCRSPRVDAICAGTRAWGLTRPSLSLRARLARPPLSPESLARSDMVPRHEEVDSGRVSRRDPST